MILSMKQASFLLVFLLSWLLLLLLGESYLNFVLLGVLAVAWWLFRGQLRWERVSQWPWVAWLWLLFWLGLAVSTAFTSSLPLSLEAVSHYLFASFVFWFVYLLDEDFMPTRHLLQALLLVGGVMVLVSFIFSLFPSWANLLPGMNLLHATYGHNHLAALMLLLLPLAWWAARKRFEQEGDYILFLLPPLFTISLLTSFGRVAIAIGLAQFLFIWWRWQPWLRLQSKIRLLFQVLGGLFVLVVAGKLFFSVITFFEPNFACPVLSLEKQLCKSIATDARPKYWHWAFKIIQDHPWWGSGPGTFSIAAPKYHLTATMATAYAHNAFLQAWADMGLVGGLPFMGLMLFLLFLGLKLVSADLKSISNNNKVAKGKIANTLSWSVASFLGLVGMYIDVLFDFDWDFIGLFALTMVLLALLCRKALTVPATPTINTVRNRLSTVRNRLTSSSDPKKKRNKQFIIFLPVALLVFLAGCYLITEYLIRFQQVSKAFDFFPYFHWQRKIYEADSNLSEAQRQKLLTTYQVHPTIYHSFLNSTSDPAKKQMLKENWAELDPWQWVKQDLTSYYLEQEAWAEADQSLTQAYDFVKKIETETNYAFSYQEKQKLAEQMLELATGLYQTGQPQLAAQWCQRSRWVNDWMLHNYRPVFMDVSRPVSAQDRLAFFVELQNLVPKKFLGQYRADYIAAYSRALRDSITSDQYQLVLDSLKLADWETNWSYQDRKQLAIALQKRAVELLTVEKLVMARQATQLMPKILPEDYWSRVQPANLAVHEGRLTEAEELFEVCLANFQTNGRGRHYDCYYGLQALKGGQPKTERYFEVAQIIQGQAVWQDFE